MWPESGSGFEADPFSPAGTAQREWILLQALGRSRYGKLAVWILLAVVVGVLTFSLLSVVFARH